MSVSRSLVLSLTLGLVTAVATPIAQVRPPAVGVTALETDAAAAPLGIDDPAPRFTWQLAGAGALQQRRDSVLVASRPELLKPGAADVWDSGVVPGADPWVTYAGPALRSRTRYVWAVQVAAGAAGSSAWSAPASFETAMLGAAEWRGQWIAGPERPGPLSPEQGAADDAAIRAAGEFCRPVGWLKGVWSAARKANNQGECRELRPAPMLRKAFRVDKPVARARLYASGLGYAELAVNGRATSTRQLEPAFTNYAKSVALHDATTSPRCCGRATTRCRSRSGPATSTMPPARGTGGGKRPSGGRRRCCAPISYVTYSDGSEAVIASDPTWKVERRRADALRQFLSGRDLRCAARRRRLARCHLRRRRVAGGAVVAGPAGTLRAEVHEPIRIVDRRGAGPRAEPRPGIVVYDVGQNLTGWVELAVEAPAGTAIELFYAEKLAADGTIAVDASNALVYGQLQTDYYIAAGRGTETWTPRFSYKGFQYVQVSGPGGRPLPPGVRACGRATSCRCTRR